MHRIPLALVVSLAACANLPAIESPDCGNGVVEDGEDCDLFGDSTLGTECGAPDGEHACRFVCEQGDPSPACPPGWACGSEGFCDFSSGTYQPTSSLHVMTETIAVGELDGDGTPDLIGMTGNVLTTRYGAGDGEFPVGSDIPVNFPTGTPVFGQVDENGVFDALVPVLTGIFVLLGQADRTLAPVAYSSIDLGAVFGTDSARFFVVHPETGLPLQGFLTVRANRMWLDDNVETPLPLGTDADDIAGRVAVADLDPLAAPGSGGDEFALAFGGAGAVPIYELAKEPAVDPDGFAYRIRLRGAPVTLPLSTTVRPGYGARMADVDGDGDTDLMVSVDVGLVDPVERVAVALNNGAGAFGAATIDNFYDELILPPDAPSSQRWPLAAGDMNGDGRADYVGDAGVCIRLPDDVAPRDVCVTTAFRTTPVPWTEAIVADFNRDGANDFVVSSEGVSGVEFFLGNGTGFFNRFRVETPGAPSLLRSGDYDGDFVTDLALVVKSLSAGNQLYVLYGQTTGGPATPLAMGNLQTVVEIEPAMLLFGATFDATHDLFVVSRGVADPNARSVAILLGTSQRRMVSPFILEEGGQFHLPLVVHGGQFVGDSNFDMMAVSIAHNAAGDDIRPSLWVMKGSGDAQFLAQDTISMPLPPDKPFDPGCAHLASGDLDGGGSEADVLVAVDNSIRCADRFNTAASHFLRLHAVEDTGGALEIVVDSVLDELQLRVPASMRFTDLDGDGRPELIVSYVGFEGFAGPVGGGVAVRWNVGGDVNLSGLTNTTLVPEALDQSCPECLFPATAATPINADGDPQLELAVLTIAGIYVLEYDATTKEFLPAAEPVVRFANAGPDGPTFFGSREPQKILAADVNRDGLDDVLYTEENLVNVYTAVGQAGLRTVISPPEGTP